MKNNMKNVILLFLITSFFLKQNIYAQKLNTDSLTANKLPTILQFLNLSSTDKIADVGTSSGYSLIPIANKHPDIIFTVEDIDSSSLNRKKLLKQIKRFGNIATIEQFNIVYGTETSTNLPTAAFNKVLLTGVVHEFSDKKIMLQDVKRILTKNGSLFIEEVLVHKPVKKDRICNYPFFTENDFKVLMMENKFTLVKEKITFDTGSNRYIKIFEYMVAL